MPKFRATKNEMIGAYGQPFENKGEVVENPETGELFFNEDVRWAESYIAQGNNKNADVWELAYRRFYRFPYKIPESLEDAQTLLARVRAEIEHGATSNDPTIGPILDLIDFILINNLNERKGV